MNMEQEQNSNLIHKDLKKIKKIMQMILLALGILIGIGLALIWAIINYLY